MQPAKTRKNLPKPAEILAKPAKNRRNRRKPDPPPALTNNLPPAQTIPQSPARFINDPMVYKRGDI
jgi:hypothetical protein